jgi:hypothetical protein
MPSPLLHPLLPRILGVLLALSVPGIAVADRDKDKDDDSDRHELSIETPPRGQLSLVGEDVAFEIRLPRHKKAGRLVVTLDGEPVDPASLSQSGKLVSGVLDGLGEGRHELVARLVDHRGRSQDRSATWFEQVALDRPDLCEFLNDADCLMPFPSSRFLEPDATTPTGLRLALPQEGMPRIVAGSRRTWSAACACRSIPRPSPRTTASAPRSRS